MMLPLTLAYIYVVLLLSEKSHDVLEKSWGTHSKDHHRYAMTRLKRIMKKRPDLWPPSPEKN